MLSGVDLINGNFYRKESILNEIVRWEKVSAEIKEELKSK